MKVKDVMTHMAVCCRPDANAGAAVELLWVHNCGMLPVTTADGKLAGVVTDRDLCIALGTRRCLPGDLPVAEVMSREVATCSPEDDIHEAMSTMATRQVRRLPVTSKEGIPQGILSMDDIITHGDLNKWQGFCELSSEEIVRSLKKLYRGKWPIVALKKAVAA
jgi:CBS domain-containing protein